LIAVAQSNAIATHKPDRMHGSYHWNLERAASVALIPILSTQLVYGASPVLDTLLGVALPLHLHIGKLKYIHILTTITNTYFLLLL
jgi:succinate dehydrogenase (ubiquinone) membrane anchor subunit